MTPITRQAWIAVSSRRSSPSAKRRKRSEARYTTAKTSGGPATATRSASGGRDGGDWKSPAAPAPRTARNHPARTMTRGMMRPPWVCDAARRRVDSARDGSAARRDEADERVHHQRSQDERAARQRGHTRPLVQHEPDPERSQHGLEHADERALRGRNQ